MSGFERADVLDKTARELLEMFTETVIDWEHANLVIDSLDGRPLPIPATDRWKKQVDELARAFALGLIRWAAEAAADAAGDRDLQIALVRESYEMGLTVVVELDAAELDVIYGLRLLIGILPWGGRIQERRLRDLYAEDLGRLLSVLEEKRVVRRIDEWIWFACW